MLRYDKLQSVKIAPAGLLTVFAEEKLRHNIENLRADDGVIYPPSYAQCFPETGMDRIEDAILFSLLLNSINYCFFTLMGATYRKYEDIDMTGKAVPNTPSGSTLMNHCLIKAWPEMRDRYRYSLGVNTADVNRIFGRIPFPENRARDLSEVLKHGESILRFLTGNFGTGAEPPKFGYLIAEFINTVFSGYNDWLMKRSQLFVQMLSGFIRHKFGWRKDSGKRFWGRTGFYNGMTICADYQIPRTLRYNGILTYTPHLAQIVDSGALLELNTHEYEKEIRVASIIASNELAKIVNVPDPVIDIVLWGMKYDIPAAVPYHRTITTNY